MDQLSRTFGPEIKRLMPNLRPMPSAATIRQFFAISLSLGLSQLNVTAEIYTWNFMSGDFDNLSLTPFGDGAVSLARPGREGLRLQLPTGEKTKGIGFATRFQLSGDFEVTIRYRIDNIETPADGWGAGLSLYLTTVADQQPAAQLSRLSRQKGKEIHAVFRALPVEGERTKIHKHFDTDVNAGKLRMARIENRLVCSVAADYSDEFEILYEGEFDTADVGLLRVSMQQSSPETGGAVFVEHLDIIADSLPHMPSKLAQNERIYLPRYQPKPTVPSRAWMAYLSAAIVLAAGLGTWFVKRR